jgi:phosphatidylserine/phosphatidylglycerophosphate/cardiolipin synthase-like enzyme
MSTSDAETVRRAVAQGLWQMPWSKVARAAGLSAAAEDLSAFDDVPAAGLIAVIDAVIAERADRPAPAEIVWTGPEPVASASRDTAAVVEGMLRQARREVLLSSFSFDVVNDPKESIFLPLSEVMAAHGVQAHVFYDVAWVAKRVGKTPHQLSEAKAFLDVYWPFEAPRPRLYFDPRGLEEPAVSNMHAKMVVVDRRHVLIGSANLTDRGTTRSIELGVKLDDPELAERLIEHWFGAIHAGRFHRAG